MISIKSIVLTKTKHGQMNARKDTYSRVTDFVIQGVSSVIREHESVQEYEVLCIDLKNIKKINQYKYLNESKHTL